MKLIDPESLTDQQIEDMAAKARVVLGEYRCHIDDKCENEAEAIDLMRIYSRKHKWWYVPDKEIARQARVLSKN